MVLDAPLQSLSHHIAKTVLDECRFNSYIMHTNCIDLVCDCTVRMNFFANRVINAWNNLRTSVSFTIVYPLLEGH